MLTSQRKWRSLMEENIVRARIKKTKTSGNPSNRWGLLSVDVLNSIFHYLDLTLHVVANALTIRQWQYGAVNRQWSNVLYLYNAQRRQSWQLDIRPMNDKTIYPAIALSLRNKVIHQIYIQTSYLEEWSRDKINDHVNDSLMHITQNGSCSSIQTLVFEHSSMLMSRQSNYMQHIVHHYTKLVQINTLWRDQSPHREVLWQLQWWYADYLDRLPSVNDDDPIVVCNICSMRFAYSHSYCCTLTFRCPMFQSCILCYEDLREYYESKCTNCNGTTHFACWIRTSPDTCLCNNCYGSLFLFPDFH